MRFYRNKLNLAVTGLILILLFVPGCSPKTIKELRRHTYPPEFNYITHDKLESTMWQFAAKVKQLEKVMREADLSVEGPAGEGPKNEVDRILSEMENISLVLGSKGWPGNHPKVARHIVMFRNDLAAARRALKTNPPNYFLAGSITGACSHCHRAK